jgi:hypothetical protein
MNKEIFELLGSKYAKMLFTVKYSGYVRIITSAELDELIEIYHKIGYKDQVKVNCSNCALNMCTRIARQYYKYEEEQKAIKEAPVVEELVKEEIKVPEQDIKLVKVSKKINRTKK